MKIIKILLFPFALLYGMVMFIRNKLFDWRVLPSKSFDIPVISVGNLTLGGTGKTPHVEYLINLLMKDYSIATLSRGYGRKTKGFIIASDFMNYLEIGDEPLQFKHKFEDIHVVVDEKRRRGIKLILKKIPDLDVVILDDALQHRYVKPGLSILLSDYHNLYTKNYPFPTGTLREFRLGAKRADIIIVTKMPKVYSPITKRMLVEEIKPKAHQKLYFSYISYGDIKSIKDENEPFKINKVSTILMFAGIANTYPLEAHLKGICGELIVMNFPDHHKYSEKDLLKIKGKFNEIFTTNKIIITTEKDMMRLIKQNLYNIIKDFPIYYIPIEIKFHKDDGSKFDNQIMEYVEKNTRNRQLH